MFLYFIAVLFLIYFPTAALSYFVLGDCIAPSMLDSLDHGALKDVAQVLILLHLIAATPICLNPPSQWLESLLKIPPGKSIFHLLFVGFISPLFSTRELKQYTSLFQVSHGKDVFLGQAFWQSCCL